MEPQQISEIVTGIVNEVAYGSKTFKTAKEIKEESILKEDSGRDTLELDSLDMTDLQLKLEGEFNISIPDEDVPNWDTVGDVIKYIEGKAI